MTAFSDSSSSSFSRDGDGAPEARFQIFNRDRLHRVYASLLPRQEALIRVLPLLFHANHPLLPGYVSQETPSGISDYSPDQAALSAVRQLARTYVFEQRMLRSFAINGLYLMGSPGTIAYTRDSDFDVWLVHDPALAPEAIALLRDKARRIEDFSAHIGLEMHFFVFDAESFRHGATLDMSNESAGSSQHFLLLDEFYRSSILLAGMLPMWWAVPPEAEHCYTEFVAEALHTRRLSAQRFVDFGGLEQIPAGEFFGATVWQLYKSIESPYKSVMKLLLMEAYAASYPNISELLSHRHKRALLQPDVTLDQLDPYLAMYRRVEEYLQHNHDETRLRVLRRAFYLKASDPLNAARSSDWRRELMQQLLNEWEFTPQEIKHLDERPHWRIDNAVEERRDIVKVLQKSYASLSDFARTHGDKRITETDLSVLGRKLYAAFDKKPNKIELISRGLCTAPEETELSLYQLTFERAGTQWVLFRGNVTPDELANKSPLHRSSALLDVLAWSFFNRLCNSQTVWHCSIGSRRQSPQNVRRLLETLEAHYPSRELVASETLSLSLPARVVSARFFVNFSLEAAGPALPDGGVMTSNRTDAFQFGGQRVNLVKSVDLLLQTSWEELFSYHFEGDDSPLKAACEYLNRFDPARALPGEEPDVHCFDLDYGQLIAQRVNRFLQTLRTAHGRIDSESSSIVTARLGDKLFDVTLDDNGASYRTHATLASLTRALGEQSPRFKQVWFDPACAPESPLQFIYQRNQRGIIQVYAWPRRDRIDVFVLDGDGSLVSYLHQDPDPHVLFSHLHQFFENAQRHSPAFDGEAAGSLQTVEFAIVQTRAAQEFSALAVAAPTVTRRNYLPLRLYVDLDANGKTQFSAYLEDQEFSSGEHGVAFFDAIAVSVRSRRVSRGHYPVFITDLELSDRLLRERGLEPRHLLELLRQKLRIERQLSQALLKVKPDGHA